MDIKCLFLGYCEETKSYRLTCLQTKNIIGNKDVVFMKDNISIRNDLEMHPNKKNEGYVVVAVSKPSKSYSCNDSKKCEKQVRNHLASNEEMLKLLVGNDGCVEKFGKDNKLSYEGGTP